MKSEKEIRQQLKETYEYRLGLRIERKEKKVCKNCVNGLMEEVDLGDLGVYKRYFCKCGLVCDKCSKFKCKYTREDIENEMLEDIKDPSICGCKEPKIAVLLWVLHNGSEISNVESESEKKSFMDRISSFFTRK